MCVNTYTTHAHLRMKTLHAMEHNAKAVEAMRKKLEQARLKRSQLAVGVFSRDLEQLLMLEQNTKTQLDDLFAQRDKMEKGAELLRFGMQNMQVCLRARMCVCAIVCIWKCDKMLSYLRFSMKNAHMFACLHVCLPSCF